MTRIRKILGIFAALTAIALSLHADDPTAPAQNPAPVNAVEIDGGHVFELSKNVKDTSFYKVAFHGNTLTESGTPIKFAKGLDLAAPAIPATGDRPALALLLEHGLSTLGGTLFAADGAKPLHLNGLERLNLRGTALVTGKTAGGPIEFAAGLETPPFRVPGLQRSQFSNWLVFGVNAQHEEKTDSPADKNFGLATYRTFVGKAFGWHKSADVGKTAAGIESNFLKQAPTLADAKLVAEKIKQIDANKRSAAQQLFLDTLEENGDDAAIWTTTVRDMARGNADAITDQQTFALYAESSGWYAFRGSGKHGLKNLITISVDYWPLTGHDEVLLRARYENGYERGAPTDRKNHFVVSAVVRY